MTATRVGTKDALSRLGEWTLSSYFVDAIRRPQIDLHECFGDEVVYALEEAQYYHEIAFPPEDYERCPSFSISKRLVGLPAGKSVGRFNFDELYFETDSYSLRTMDRLVMLHDEWIHELDGCVPLRPSYFIASGEWVAKERYVILSKAPLFWEALEELAPNGW